MENLTKLNNHKLERIVEEYRKAMSIMVRSGKVQMVTYLLQDSHGYSSLNEILDYMKDINSSDEEKKILQIHFCLATLGEEGREIIWNEFFNKKTSFNKTPWWANKYSRSTFYRLKNKWVTKFIDLCGE